MNIIWLLFASCMVSPDAVLDSIDGFGVEGELYNMSVQIKQEVRRSI